MINFIAVIATHSHRRRPAHMTSREGVRARDLESKKVENNKLMGLSGNVSKLFLGIRHDYLSRDLGGAVVDRSLSSLDSSA